MIVLGLGAMGSAAAYELARAGASVLGLEQFGPFHDQGSSHGRTRMIRKVYMEGEVYLPLLERSYEKLRAHLKIDPRPVLNIFRGRYVGEQSDHIITRTLAMAKAHKLALEELEPEEVTRRFPAFRPDPDMVGLFDPEAGYTNPAGIFSFYHRMAKEHGAALRFNEKVRSIRVAKNEIRIRTGQRDYRGKKLIVCAGAWLGKVAAGLGVSLPLEVRRAVNLQTGAVCPEPVDFGGRPDYLRLSLDRGGGRGQICLS